MDGYSQHLLGSESAATVPGSNRTSKTFIQCLPSADALCQPINALQIETTYCLFQLQMLFGRDVEE